MEVFNTIVTSVLILVITQLILKWIIEPLQEFARLKGEIAHSLTNYANVGGKIESLYLSSLDKLADSEKESDKLLAERERELIRAVWKKRDDASEHLRQQASHLRATVSVIPFFYVWVVLGFLPPKENVLKASSGLIGMSNSTQDGGMAVHIDNVAKLLNVKLVP